MRKKLSILLSLALLVPWMTSFQAKAAQQPDYDGYIVGLREDSPSLLGGEPSNFLVVENLEEALSVPTEWVEYIEPNYLVELLYEEPDWTPDDPYYISYQQQTMELIGGLAACRAGLTGEGITVGFIDSGINVEHEDLDPSRITGMNFNADGKPYDQDVVGHGTFAAGIVAAQTNNGLGLAGLAPGVNIRAYRVFSQKNAQISDVAKALDQAVQDGCQVVNLSLGATSDSQTLYQAVERAAEQGVVLVAAVGNKGGTQLHYPAAYPQVIGVGSVGPTEDGMNVSSFSQRNDSVFVTAPGEKIPGLGSSGKTSYKLELTSAANRGTSYAAPIVTALAAIALEYDRDITSEGIAYLLEASARDLGEPGYDTDYGYGVVDVPAFLACLEREFTITYELEGGDWEQPLPTSYRVTDEDIPLNAVPKREGYVCTGWYADRECTQLVRTLSAGSLGDRTFYAGWRQEELPITLELGEIEAGKGGDTANITLRARNEGENTVTCGLYCGVYDEQGAMLGLATAGTVELSGRTEQTMTLQASLNILFPKSCTVKAFALEPDTLRPIGVQGT